MVSLSLAGRSHFEEARAHLGLSQRQWSSGDCPLPCATCPVLNRDLVAHQQLLQHPFELPKAAWYQKTLPTFAMLALVRQQLWQMQTFQMSSADVDTVKVPRALFNTWSDLLCYAA